MFVVYFEAQTLQNKVQPKQGSFGFKVYHIDIDERHWQDQARAAPLKAGAPLVTEEVLRVRTQSLSAWENWNLIFNESQTVNTRSEYF